MLEQTLTPRQRVLPAPLAWSSRRGFIGSDSPTEFWSVLNNNNGHGFRVYNNGRVSINNVSARQHLSIGSNLDLYSGSANSPTRPSIRASSSNNLILNSIDDGAVYINYDGGTGGVRFHNGTISGEVMRLANNGRLGIGTTAPRTQLHVTDAASLALLEVNSIGLINSDSGPTLCATASGTWRRVQYCSSSARYKDRITALGNASELLQALRPVRFNWKDSGRADIGLIAEEVAEIIPELTERGDEGEIQGVNYRHLTAVLISAWQEQQTEIIAHNARISEQQAEILALRAELTAERETIAQRLAVLESVLLDGPAMADRTSAAAHAHEP